jgi:hypothetical protein
VYQNSEAWILTGVSRTPHFKFRCGIFPCIHEVQWFNTLKLAKQGWQLVEPDLRVDWKYSVPGRAGDPPHVCIWMVREKYWNWRSLLSMFCHIVLCSSLLLSPVKGGQSSVDSFKDKVTYANMSIHNP